MNERFIEIASKHARNTLRALPVVGLSAAVATAPNAAYGEALQQALSSSNVKAEPFKGDPGKMLVDYEIEGGSKAKISADHAVCEIMGDTTLEIDGQRLSTKGEYQGQSDVGSITRTYNRNFSVDTTVNGAKIDVLCGPMLPEVLSFMDGKHEEFVQHMHEAGCKNGCPVIKQNEFGDRTTLKSQDPGSMFIDYEPQAGARVFVSSKHWTCRYMGVGIFETPQAKFDTRDGRPSAATGSYTTIDGTNFNLTSPYAGDLLCAPNEVPAARAFLESKDSEFIAKMKAKGCEDGCTDGVMWRTLTPDGMSMKMASIVDKINAELAMSTSDKIANGVNFNRTARREA